MWAAACRIKAAKVEADELVHGWKITWVPRRRTYTNDGDINIWPPEMVERGKCVRNTRFEDVIRAWGHLHSVMRERLEAARTHYTPPALGELIEVEVLESGDGALPEWRVGKVEALHADGSFGVVINGPDGSPDLDFYETYNRADEGVEWRRQPTLNAPAQPRRQAEAAEAAKAAEAEAEAPEAEAMEADAAQEVEAEAEPVAEAEAEPMEAEIDAEAMEAEAAEGFDVAADE